MRNTCRNCQDRDVEIHKESLWTNESFQTEVENGGNSMVRFSPQYLKLATLFINLFNGINGINGIGPENTCTPLKLCDRNGFELTGRGSNPCRFLGIFRFTLA